MRHYNDKKRMAHNMIKSITIFTIIFISSLAMAAFYVTLSEKSRIENEFILPPSYYVEVENAIRKSRIDTLNKVMARIENKAKEDDVLEKSELLLMEEVRKLKLEMFKKDAVSN